MTVEIAAGQQVYFEDVAVGDPLPSRTYGPHTIQDAVRWAGLQENWQHLHFDRDHVREHNGLKGFIASGAYRQALLVRLLTDWVGPRGALRKLSLRHTSSTFEGDLMRFSGRVTLREVASGEGRLTCEVVGHNQDAREILVGTCVLALPRRAEAPET